MCTEANKDNDILYLIALFSSTECRIRHLALLLYPNLYGPEGEGEKNLTLLFSCSLQNFSPLQYDHMTTFTYLKNISTKKNYPNKRYNILSFIHKLREQQIFGRYRAKKI